MFEQCFRPSKKTCGFNYLKPSNAGKKKRNNVKTQQCLWHGVWHMNYSGLIIKCDVRLFVDDSRVPTNHHSSEVAT